MQVPVRLSMLSCTAIAVLVTNAAWAQSSAADAGKMSTEGTQLGEVIVTAQKRSERLQDVPIAITAVNASQLSAVGVHSVVDLRVAAPALNSANADGYFASSIRGVGSFNYAAGAESPVGLYIDGVYVAAAQAAELALNNIESVQVLKGPQGSLFGRNTTGGVIMIATPTPTDVSTGNFSVGYGRYNTETGSAYVSGGLANGLAADVAVTASTQGEGWGRNVVTGEEIDRARRNVTVRSKLAWTPGAHTRVIIIGNYWNGDDTQGVVQAYPGKISGYIPGYLNTDLGYNMSTNLNFRKLGSTAGGSLKIEHDFGGTVRISSISAYREGTNHFAEDLDFTPVNLAGLFDVQQDRQASQELQLSSIGNSRLKWTGGVYYFYLNSGYHPADINEVNIPGVGAYIALRAAQTAESGAAYGQATYEIGHDTNLTLGGRFTAERRAEDHPFELIELPALGLSLPAPFPDRSISAGRVTYRVSVDHRFSDQFMAYTSFNTGFKSGGYNVSSPGAPAYKPETLKAYELGVKTDLLERRLRFDVSGFYYDYTNIQVQQVSTIALIVVNGAAARIYGVDGDFAAALSDAVSLTGGFDWISPYFRSFPNCPISSPVGGVPLTTGSCAGNQIPFAAKFTGSVALDYSASLGSGRLLAAANVYYNSGYFFESDGVLTQPRYAKLGASVKWTSDRGYSVGVYGSNLTDRRTAAFAATQSNGNAVISYSAPRTYGITFGYQY